MWNKGIITKALPVFCNYLFSKFDFNRLTAKVFEGKRCIPKSVGEEWICFRG